MKGGKAMIRYLNKELFKRILIVITIMSGSIPVKIYAQSSPFPEGYINPFDTISYNYGSLNYLIITADSLRPAFKDFAMSKALKGYDVKIAAVEDIYQTYSNITDSVERIKWYIAQYYMSCGKKLQFVLLGGNAEIIPTRFCVSIFGYGDNENFPSDPIPCDYYYVCFYKSFNWNANGDHDFGDLTYDTHLNPNNHPTLVLSDNVNFHNYINVSRLPVRNSNDIKNYTKKLLRYERGELSSISYSQILFGGNAMYYDTLGISDANYWGDSISNFISQTYSNVRIDKLYDTQSSFSGKTFVAQDLQDVWSNNGYVISYIEGHGSHDSWLTSDSSRYNSLSATLLSSPSTSFITTTACHTADFTEQDNLGSAFILGLNNSNIAYWGSSHMGWLWINNSRPGVSRELVGSFFRHLASDDIKHIGHIVNKARDAYVDDSLEFFTRERFLSFSQTLLGDGEAKVYLSYPQRIIPFDLFINGGEAVMDNYDEDAHYNIMIDNIDSTLSTHNSDYTYLFPHTEWPDSSFLYEGPFQIGITKDGYAPWRSDKDYYATVSIQNTILDGEHLRAQNFVIAKSVDSDFFVGANTVAAGSNVTFEVGNSLTITDDFTCPVGATMTIKALETTY